MKKIILVILFLVVSITINAQDNEAFKKDTERLVEIVAGPAFKPVIEQFSGMVATDKKEEFLKELDKTFPALYVEMAKIYMEEFTHDEIKNLLDFYATPTGIKIAEKSVVLSQKGMAVGQSWGMKIQGLITQFQ